MTIQPNALSGNFNDTLYQFLRTDNVEGCKNFVYLDSIGLPTIGAGYALIIKQGTAYTAIKEDVYLAAFTQAGITLSEPQKATLALQLQDAYDALTGKAGAINPFYSAASNHNILDWTITDAQAETLAQSKFGDALKAVKTWLGNDTLYNSLVGKREMLALASLAYNGWMGKDKSPSLQRALTNGDRAEAWYEIRYATPDNNKARHFAEAALLGLFDNACAPTSDEAKSVYRMLTLHRDAILAYETVNAQALSRGNDILANANNSALNLHVQSIANELADAKSRLFSDFNLAGNGISSGDYLATNIYLDPGRNDSKGTVSDDHAAVLDARQYEWHVDIGLGTVTVTGTEITSNDILIGEGDNDKLIGGKGNDVLLGGTGDDCMYGGEGADTYIFTTGDGADTIIDAANDGYGGDGQGKIVFDGQDLAGSYALKNDSATEWTDGTFTFTFVGKAGGGGLLVITKAGAGAGDRIVVSNFHDGDFGIHLNGTPAATLPPSTAAPIETITLFNNAPHPYYNLSHAARTELAVVGVDAEGWANGKLVGDGNDNYLHDGYPAMTVASFSGARASASGDADNDVLIGNAGRDALVAEAGNDILDGGEGDDALAGGDGDDQLDGGAGMDILSGGAGLDVLLGGAGDDILLGGGSYRPDTHQWTAALSSGTWHLDQFVGVRDVENDGTDYLDGGDGNDWIEGGEQTDQLLGGAGNDWLVGGSEGDLLDGGDGDDRLCGDGWIVNLVDYQWLPEYHGDDILSGGAGNDALWGDGGNDTLDGGDGDDQLVGDNDGLAAQYHGQDTLYGGAGADTLFGYGKDDYLDGGTGDDQLVGGAGADVLLGGAGSDKLWGDGSSVSVADQGADVLDGGAGNDQLFGGGGGDILDGGEGDDILSGGAGDDTYILGAGEDVILESGAGGVDKVMLDYAGDDIALYRRGDDLVIANVPASGNASTLATVYDHFLASENQIEAIEFADGSRWDAGAILANTVAGAPNAMFGTAGNDTFIVDDAGDTISEGSEQGIDTVVTSISWTLGANLENLTLALHFDIDGTGNVLDNVITGNVGDNRLDGGGGSDTLIGGVGNDTYVVTPSTEDTVIELLGEGTDTVIADLNYTLPDNVENLTIAGTRPGTILATGNALDNVLVGRAGDVLDGGAGADSMTSSGRDTVFVVDNPGDFVYGPYGIVRSSIDWTLVDGLSSLVLLPGSAALRGIGNAMDNTLTGNENANTLYGMAGDDVFRGGDGVDILVGGAGNDVYCLDGGESNIAGRPYPERGAPDIILELPDEGEDTVQSTIDYTLGDNLENLSLLAYNLGNGFMGYAISGTGNALDNRLAGNYGNNLLDGGAGADTMTGGGGDDSYRVDNAGDLIVEYDYVGAGVDTVFSSIAYALPDNVENLVLVGSGNDSGTGNALGNRLDGSQSAGANLLAGGAGDDTYILGAGDTAVEVAGEGNDTVIAESTYVLTDPAIENLSLSGTANIDATGNARDNILAGNAGNNRLTGGGGNDTYLFGRHGGQDVVVDTDTAVGNVDRLVFAADIAQTDIALSREGNNLVASITGTTDRITVENYFTAAAGATIEEIGFAGSATVWNRTEITQRANNQAPVLAVPLADRTVSMGATTTFAIPTSAFTDPDAGDSLSFEATLANGGALPDFLSFDGATGGFTATPLAYMYLGTYDIRVTAHDTAGHSVADIFALTVTDPSVTLTGTASANTLTGGIGNDFLYGLGGNDTLVGQGGNDWLDGGTGSDNMQGGTGDDTYIVDATGDKTTESANAGWDAVQSSVTWTLANNVEQLTLTGTAAINGTGNTLNNEIVGNDAANTLTGNAGDDGLIGMGGNDTLAGNAGSDYLDGGAGNDSLTGGSGNDYYVLARGYGADTIVENDTAAGNNDQAIFAADISAEQLWFRHVGTNLEVSVIGTADKFVFKNWYSGSAYHVEEFFAEGDGRILYDENVEALVQAMAALTIPAAGQTTLSTAYLNTLAPVFESCWG